MATGAEEFACRTVNEEQESVDLDTYVIKAGTNDSEAQAQNKKQKLDNGFVKESARAQRKRARELNDFPVSDENDTEEEEIDRRIAEEEAKAAVKKIWHPYPKYLVNGRICKAGVMVFTDPFSGPGKKALAVRTKGVAQEGMGEQVSPKTVVGGAATGEGVRVGGKKTGEERGRKRKRCDIL